MSRSSGSVRRRTAPSIADVARLAGVSSQTVSRVSTGAEVVRPQTRERVLQAMDQLGYSPNKAARALRNGSFGTLGVMTQQLNRTGEALTTAEVVTHAEEAGYSVTLIQVRDPESTELRDAAHRLAHQAIDGLIIVRVGHASHESLSLPAGLPVAVSDSALIGHYPSVTSNQIQGTRDAVNHLLDLGHRTVYHITGDPDSQPALVRQMAWRRALEDTGRLAPEAWRGDWTAKAGYQLGARIAANPEVTAVYCGNDEMAIGLIRALHEHGRRVPDDVSIVGYDDIALAEYCFPPLTTVRQDFNQTGAELVRMVLDQLRFGMASGAQRVEIPTQLVLRGSTAAPASR